MFFKRKKSASTIAKEITREEMKVDSYETEEKIDIPADVKERYLKSGYQDDGNIRENLTNEDIYLLFLR